MSMSVCLELHIKWSPESIILGTKRCTTKIREQTIPFLRCVSDFFFPCGRGFSFRKGTVYLLWLEYTTVLYSALTDRVVQRCCRWVDWFLWNFGVFIHTRQVLSLSVNMYLGREDYFLFVWGRLSCPILAKVQFFYIGGFNIGWDLCVVWCSWLTTTTFAREHLLYIGPVVRGTKV